MALKKMFFDPLSGYEVLLHKVFRFERPRGKVKHTFFLISFDYSAAVYLK